MRYLKKFSRIAAVLIVVTSLSVGVALVAPTSVSAASVSPGKCADKKVNCDKKKKGGDQDQPVTSTPAQSVACSGLSTTGQSCDSNAGRSTLGSLLNNIVKIVSYIAGAAAVVMIIVAGVKYAISGGDPSAVSSAKSTLLYAIIGVAVAALAQLLVHLVLNNVGSV